MATFGLVVPQSRFLDDLTSNFEFGWLGLYVPVAGFLVWRIVRGFRAEQHAVKLLGEDISIVRDTFISQEITPTIARISATVREYMRDFKDVEHLPGQPGDPELQAERVLGYRVPTFSDGMKDLHRHFATVTRVTDTHDRKVSEYKRCAWAFAIVLVAWTYLGAAVAIADNQLPGWSVYLVLALACTAGGWACAEWWAGNKETNELSRLVHTAKQSQSGGTN